MANPEHRAILKKGVQEWNKWRKENPDIRPNLSGADLSGMELFGGHLEFVNLKNANLSRTNLSLANLSNANMRMANMSKAVFLESILRGADLSGADLSGAMLNRCVLDGANLSGVDLSSAILAQAILSKTNMRNVNFSYVDLSGQDLSGLDLSDNNFSGANLSNSNLKDTNLSRSNLTGANLRDAHLIFTDLSEASVDCADIHEVEIHGLRGLPERPNTLFDRYYDHKSSQSITRTLKGCEAADFFVRPEKVEVVLDKALTHEELAGYRMFIADCEANKQWPESVVYLEGYVKKDQMILGFQMPTAQDIINNLPLLLQPFRHSAAIDWKNTLGIINQQRVDWLLNTQRAKSKFRSKIAERLCHIDGFATSKPMEIRSVVFHVKVELDPKVVAELRPGAILKLTWGDIIMGKTVVKGDPIGSVVGNEGQVKVRDITVYKQDVQNSGLDGETKEVLVRAIEKVGTLDLEDVFKQAVAEAVNQIRTELERPQRNAGKVKAIWQSIKRVAAPVATILQTAAAVKELIV